MACKCHSDISLVSVSGSLSNIALGVLPALLPFVEFYMPVRGISAIPGDLLHAPHKLHHVLFAYTFCNTPAREVNQEASSLSKTNVIAA